METDRIKQSPVKHLLSRRTEPALLDRLERCKATKKSEFKPPWREAGPPNHHNDKVDSDQEVVNKELSLDRTDPGRRRGRGSTGSRPSLSPSIIFESKRCVFRSKSNFLSTYRPCKFKI